MKIVRGKKFSVPQRGTTLVELIVSMVLLSLSLSIMYGGMWFANNVSDRATELSANSDALMHGQRFLRRTISSAVLSEESFLGRPSTLEFVAPLRRDGLPDGRYKLSFKVQAANVAKYLQVSWEKLASPGPASVDRPVAGESVVLRDLDSLSIEYLQSGRSTGAVWASSWNGRGLPKLVRISAKFANGQVWPDLYIAPAATRAVSCVYDSVSRDCR